MKIVAVRNRKAAWYTLDILNIGLFESGTIRIHLSSCNDHCTTCKISSRRPLLWTKEVPSELMKHDIMRGRWGRLGSSHRDLLRCIPTNFNHVWLLTYSPIIPLRNAFLPHNKTKLEILHSLENRSNLSVQLRVQEVKVRVRKAKRSSEQGIGCRSICRISMAACQYMSTPPARVIEAHILKQSSINDSPAGLMVLETSSGIGGAWLRLPSL